MQNEGQYYVYFIQSVTNGKIYTGKTEKDPEIRVKEHNYGTNIWTRQNGPFILVYFEKYCCKNDMDEREKFFKTGFGKKIRNAILKELNSSVSAKGRLASGWG